MTKDGRRLSHDAVLSKQNNGQIKCLSTNLTLAAPANLCLVDYYERERRSSASDASAGTVLIQDTIAAAVRQRLLSDYYELERRTSAMDLAIGSANKIRYGVDVTTPNPKRCGRHEDEHTKMRRVREGAAGARSARWPASQAVVG